MEGLLLDNWTFENITKNIYDQENFSNELIGFFEALVLWDNIYYFDNGYSTFWQNIIKKSNCYNICNIVKPLGFEKSNKSLEQAEEHYLDYSNAHTSLIAKGALEYLYLSASNNLNYMPFGKRAEFINDNNLFQKINNIFDRNDVIHTVDNDIQEFFDNINKDLTKAQLKFNPHCLFNYINKSSSNLSDMFSTAIELSQSPSVKAFKCWVSNLENEISQGQYPLISRYKKALKIIENDLINEYQKSNISISASLPLGFSVNINIPFKECNAHLLFPASLYKQAITSYDV